jgi:drug/metabolite transporter (DMT)-like permease
MSLNLSKGVWYMIYASFAFSLMNVCIKYIPHIPPIEIVLFRSVVSLVISLFFLLNQGVPIWGNNKKILFLRGFTGAIALTLFFMLLQQIPLAAATSMQYMAPIFTAVLGIFIVKEKVANRQFLYFGLSLLGIFVIQGFDTRISLFHLLLGLITSIFTGLAYNFIRKLKTSEHPLVIIFYFPLVTIPFAAIYAYFNWVNPFGWDWLILILVGLLTQVAQYFMTKSYQSEELSKVSIIQYVGIIYALGFGYFIFGETYNWLTYIGMILVFSGVILNLWNKRNT